MGAWKTRYLSLLLLSLTVSGFPIYSEIEGEAQDKKKNAAIEPIERTIDDVDGLRVEKIRYPISLPHLPRMKLKLKDPVFEQAYGDVFAILAKPGRCSGFYGGPESAIEVFNGLVRTTESGAFDSTVGVQMSGSTTDYTNARTGFRYRLFDRAILNKQGPFYTQKLFNSQRIIPPIGSYMPNTRAARALMLLHEMAHLVRDSNDRWLIPDDGAKPELSRENTRKVETLCGSELSVLHNEGL